MTYRIRFDRLRVSASDLIRQILASVELRDLLIEDEPIEEIIKRIYAGEASLADATDGATLSKASWGADELLAPYLEFARVGFVNILAFRLRYYTGIITYLINVDGVLLHLDARYLRPAAHIAVTTCRRCSRTLAWAGSALVLLEHHRSGNGLRSDRRQDRHGFDQAGVACCGCGCARAMGESAFRLGLLTVPTAIVVSLIFPVQRPASAANFGLFLLA